MAPLSLPSVVQSISKQWPCRETQIQQLAYILSPTIPSPPTIVVHGISATCKTSITRAILSEGSIPHAIIRCQECITGRHLLTKILLEVLATLGLLNSDWERFGKGKCEHVASLAVLLGDALRTPAAAGKKFVVVLDGIDKQREASHTLLAALARLGEIIPNLTLLLILSTTPRPLFLQNAGVPHISFPPYTRKEAITIMTSAADQESSIMLDGLSTDQVSRLYPQFVATVYDSLVGPTAGTIPQFRSICERLWPKFVAPIVNNEKPPGVTSTSSEWDFARLLVRNRALFRVQGEDLLVHRITTDEDDLADGPDTAADKGTTTKIAKTTSTRNHHNPAPSLPYFPTLVLTSAYIASHTPPRLDTIFFSKFSSSSLSARNKRAHHRRRLKLLSQARAAAAEDSRANDLDNSAPKSSSNGRRKSSSYVFKTPGDAKRHKTKITKSLLDSAFATSSAATTASSSASGLGPALAGGPQGSTILTARPFTLERLLAIYRAIDPNPAVGTAGTGGTSISPPIADAVYAELATLRRLRLVVPSSSAAAISSGSSGAGSGGGAGGAGGTGNSSADLGEKWCINVSGDWIDEMAKGIGVEVGEWLAGGLD